MTVKIPEWWEDECGYFGRDYLDLHEGSILTHERTVYETDFLEQALLGRGWLFPRNQLKILDVPCGYGRHVIELAGRSTRYKMTGYELNQNFLDHAQELAAGVMRSDGSTISVDWRQGDMRDLPFTDEFHVVLNLFSSVGYFKSDQDDERFFSGVHQALRPGGFFVVDVPNRDEVLRYSHPEETRPLPDGRQVHSSCRYDVTTGRIREDVAITSSIDTERLYSDVRLYSPPELIAMAERVGLGLLFSYGDFDVEHELTINSPRCILVFYKSTWT